MSRLGVLAFIGLVVVVFFGDRLAPYEPVYFVVDHGQSLRPYDPGVVFPWGSDVLGRDLISLVLAGARATLAIALLAGLIRVITGALVAGLTSWWRPARLATEAAAELASAIPATLVALVVVRAFTTTDTSVLVFCGALLLVGWAGPYRVLRAELDRLVKAPYMEGALAVGVGRWRIFWRYQLPHLVPALSMNVTQQVVAALVLIAELAVLGVFVGPVRSLDVSESQEIVRISAPTTALVADTSEWGAMLATSRTVDALWVTRWLIFVPGLAFALTATAVALIGFALARRYARRDVFQDIRGAGALVLVCTGLFLVSSALPERYAGARDWADAAREAVSPVADLGTAFREAGLQTYSVSRENTKVVRSGPATVTLGDDSVAERYPRPQEATSSVGIQALLSGQASGGVVEAPLVFAARGIVPSAHQQVRPPARRPVPGQTSAPLLGALIKDYPDDYERIDVRGKIVLLVRFMGVDASEPGGVRGDFVAGPSVGASISEVIRRGAAAVLFVDPQLSSYTSTDTATASVFGVRVGSQFSPYLQMERESPPTSSAGIPVVILDQLRAQSLVEPFGIDLSGLTGHDVRETKWSQSPARELGVVARVEVPVRKEVTGIASTIAEVPGIPVDVGRVVVWAERVRTVQGASGPTQPDPARADVLGTLARVTSARRAPFIFVDFDPAADASAVRAALKDRRIVLVLIVADLDGGVVRFRTVHGDLIPAFDLYAANAGVPHEVTRTTASSESLGAIRPFIEVKTVVISAGGSGDARADVSALISYVAGRYALGAPELPR